MSRAVLLDRLPPPVMAERPMIRRQDNNWRPTTPTSASREMHGAPGALRREVNTTCRDGETASQIGNKWER